MTACIAPRSGLAGNKHYGCKCEVCAQAGRDYQNRRARLIAYGRWEPLVDAEPVRQHVRAQMAAGLGWQRLGKLAGVSNGTISKLLYGTPERAPTKRIRRETAEALLAVKATFRNAADNAKVDGTGTRRRIGALAAAGWSLSEQARRLGWGVNNYSYMFRHKSSAVTAATARKVAALYDELERIEPPVRSGARTRAWAAKQGLLGPAWWDDIDDPHADPLAEAQAADTSVIDEVAVDRALRGWDVTLTKAEKHYAVHEGRRRGRALTDVALTLHLNYDQAKKLAAKPLPAKAA
jgi:hypothetical protein